MSRLSRLIPLVLATWILIVGHASAVSSSEPSSFADRDIVLAIEERLSKNEGVLAHLVDVIVRNGIVTVKGTVDNLLAKERIAQLASTMKSVRAVINRLQVVPSLPSTDSEIKAHVERALLDNPATELYDLHISVNDGVVMLHGAVQSWQEQQLSMTVAKGIRGVRHVQEQITIETTTHRSDQAIAHEIAQRLKYDVWLSHDDIHVHVLDGKVTLTGEVHSVEEKNRAGRLAWISGVTSVITDELQVNWEKQNPMQKPVLAQVPDQAVREAIRQTFAYDPRLSSSDIEIDVKHGTLTLQGTVPNLGAKTAAEDNANHTVGIHRVIDLLKVRPSSSVTDASIENRVDAALQRDPFLHQESLRVSVHEGRVYLEGKVRTTFQKSQAEIVTSRVKGVIDVVNRIHHPFRWLWKSDWEIKEDVRQAFQWSPHLLQANIQVHVENGEVTLKGTVQNRKQFHLAQRTALEIGARSVRNQLETLPLH